jgi:hypothetical protein
MKPDLQGTLLVATAAAFLGLLANAALEWIRQALANSQRARSVRRVLLEELLSAQRTAEGNIGAEPPKADEGVLVPITERYPLYEEHRGSLGLLSANEVSLIAAAYTQLAAFPQKMLVAGEPRRLEGYLFVMVPPAMSAVVPAQFRGVFDRVSAATSALQAKLD